MCSTVAETCKSVFYGYSVYVCVCVRSDTWSTGLLMSLQLIAVQEFTIYIKFESNNIETLKFYLNNPVGNYLLSVSVRESPRARNCRFPRNGEAES